MKSDLTSDLTTNLTSIEGNPLRLRAKAAIAECRRIATMSEEEGRTTRRFLTPPVAQVHAHLRERMAALRMLLETEGRPTRITIDIERLIAEARTIMDGYF